MKNVIEKATNIIGVVALIVSIILDVVIKVDSKILITSLYIVSYILIAHEIIINGIKNILKFNGLDENFLMTIATVGAIILGEYLEATMVILLYKIGEYLQDLAIDRSTKKIEAAIDIRQDFANLKTKTGIEKVKSETLKIGDIIVVKNGEKVPVDGTIYSGKAHFDNSLITGESKPIEVKENEKILSGSINISDVVEIKVDKEYKDSTVSKIVDFIEKAANNKSKTEKFITRFSKIYTPTVILIAILIVIFAPLLFDIGIKAAIFRGLIFLVISCPCALVISIPLGFFVGIGQCSKRGIIVKGSNYIDLLSNIDIMCFDKTGTLTGGQFKIVEICLSKNSSITKEELLEIIAHSEFYSNHYIAKSILNQYNKKINKEDISDYKEIAGKGIKASVKGKSVIVGSKNFIEENNIEIDNFSNEKVGSIVCLAVDGKYMGYILLSDELKENSKQTIERLNKFNIETMILTGDKEKIAASVAKTLAVKSYKANLLPEDKSKYIQELKNDKKTVAFVGDGINDSPVIASADVGMAMGKGADISVEVANVVIINDDPLSIIDSIIISRRTKNIVKQNIGFSITIKVLFLILSTFGFTNMWLAIFSDVGVALLTVLNSLRIAKIKKWN